jgi:hypothetical protein
LATAVAAALVPAAIDADTAPPRRLIGRSALGRLVRAGLVVVVVGGTVAGATWMLDHERSSTATPTAHSSGTPSDLQSVGRPTAVPGALTGTTPASTPTPRLEPSPGDSR